MPRRLGGRRRRRPRSERCRTRFGGYRLATSPKPTPDTPRHTSSKPKSRPPSSRMDVSWLAFMFLLLPAMSHAISGAKILAKLQAVNGGVQLVHQALASGYARVGVTPVP